MKNFKNKDLIIITNDAKFELGKKLLRFGIKGTSICACVAAVGACLVFSELGMLVSINRDENFDDLYERIKNGSFSKGGVKFSWRHDDE